MNERSIHQRGRARGSEDDAASDRRPTRCVSLSLNAPYPGTHATRCFPNLPDPGESWDDFIDAWAGVDGQFDITDGPQLDAIIDLFADSGFVVVCYGALQYDTGTVNAPSVYLIEALRATKLLDEDFSEDPTELFTPIRVMYENAASPYEIASFSPHPNPCNPDEVCESCDP